MTDHTFQEHVIPILNEYRERALLPSNERLLLVIDGHGTRYNVAMWRKFEAANITMLLLPSHSSHLLQQVDKAAAKTVKRGASLKPGKKLNGKGKGVDNATTVHWREVIKQRGGNIWASNHPDIIKAGWASSGIWPLNFSQINQRQEAPQWLHTLLKDLCRLQGEGCRRIVRLLAHIRLRKAIIDDEFDFLVRSKKRQLGGRVVTGGDEDVDGLTSMTPARAPKWFRNTMSAPTELAVNPMLKPPCSSTSISLPWHCAPPAPLSTTTAVPLNLTHIFNKM